MRERETQTALLMTCTRPEAAGEDRVRSNHAEVLARMAAASSARSVAQASM